MNLANQINAVPKPQHKRNSKTAKQRGSISDKVRKEAQERSHGRCEWCGWINGSHDSTDRRWGLQCSHLIRRWNVDEETTVQDVAMLCEPSVNTGTCHNKVDFTRAGKEWAVQYHLKLLEETI